MAAKKKPAVPAGSVPYFVPRDVDENHAAPVRQYAGDAGFDLTVSRSLTIQQGSKMLIPFNLKTAIPNGAFGLLLGRSSTFTKTGLLIMPGVIDSGYRGEIMAVAWNTIGRGIVLEQGQRLAQLIILPVLSPMLDFYRVHSESELPESERGSSGFGSTG